MRARKEWKERVKAVASADVPIEESHPLRSTLEEFVATLNESPWLHAELSSTSVPQIVSLVVRPKYRRDVRANLLNFWLAARTVIVMGAEKREIGSKEELEELLTEFVEKSEFPTTVATFREIQLEHVHGTLRASALLEDDPADVPVLVEAGVHNDLARRALEERLDAPITVNVVLEERPGRGRFDLTKTYPYLESGGFGVRVLSIQPSGEKVLRIRGDVVPLADLRV
ncbi:MAG TPA: hypothetical protein VLS89_16115 [Candidatus Nanopelagicales bacterium]|nr:hypothetical protein [Candidatus Nanopelagicales bacterium]